MQVKCSCQYKNFWTWKLNFAPFLTRKFPELATVGVCKSEHVVYYKYLEDWNHHQSARSSLSLWHLNAVNLTRLRACQSHFHPILKTENEKWSAVITRRITFHCSLTCPCVPTTVWKICAEEDHTMHASPKMWITLLPPKFFRRLCRCKICAVEEHAQPSLYSTSQ